MFEVLRARNKGRSKEEVRFSRMNLNFSGKVGLTYDYILDIRPDMEYVTSKDGTQIAYERRGEGPPLVLVHGAAADHTRWKSLLPALENFFTVYAVDRRGRGQSGDVGAYAIEREYEDVVAVVDSLPVPVNLLGHSFGAICSLEASLRTSNMGTNRILREAKIYCR